MRHNQSVTESGCREGTAERGERKLKQTALVLMLLTLIGSLFDWIQPTILVPVYLVLALCLYEKVRPARLLLAVVTVAYLAVTLLRFFFGVPLRLIPKTVMVVCSMFQTLTCLCYLAAVMYLYSSPSIAAYYQKTEGNR